MEKQISFKSRARLMPQIGDQLIKNESIALLELVKNAYDADAPDVWVEMWDIDKTDKGKIIVKDNGDAVVQKRGILNDREMAKIQSFIKDNYKEMYLKWSQYSNNGYFSQSDREQ